MATPDSATASSSTSAVPRPDGLVLAPFRGLRYAAGQVPIDRVLAPPYDVIDAAGQAALYARDPHNVVRLTLPRDPEDGTSRYVAAAAQLAEWRDQGVLQVDAEPALYVYEQDEAGHVQRGLVGALALTPAEDGIVLPHENTMAGPVADRLALMTATAADLEPIFLVYEGGGTATAMVSGIDQSEPIADVVTEGVRHRLWALTDPATLAEIAADLRGRRAVIADGHHRYATYLRYQADRHAAGDGEGPWDLGLALLVDGTSFGPQVHAIHRAVPGLDVTEAAERARAGFAVTGLPESDLDGARSALETAGADGTAFVITDGKRSYLLDKPVSNELDAALPPGEHSPAWRALDVSVAHGLLVRRLWGLEDHEDVVEFHHDIASAVQSAANSGGLALLLNPTPVEDVAAVAAAGDRMPRKSTLFVPKPATGMLIRSLADG